MEKLVVRKAVLLYLADVARAARYKWRREWSPEWTTEFRFIGTHILFTTKDLELYFMLIRSDQLPQRSRIFESLMLSNANIVNWCVRTDIAENLERLVCSYSRMPSTFAWRPHQTTQFTWKSTPPWVVLYLSANDIYSYAFTALAVMQSPFHPGFATSFWASSSSSQHKIYIIIMEVDFEHRTRAHTSPFSVSWNGNQNSNANTLHPLPTQKVNICICIVFV